MSDHPRYRVALFSLLLGALVAAPASLQASGIVTNCTEAALQTALVGGGHVLLSCDSSITLTGTIIVTKDTVLDATGHTVSLSAGTLTNLNRLFLVQPGARLTLRRLTLTGSRIISTNTANGIDGESLSGAAIYNDRGVVTLDGCTISDHFLSAASGAVAVQNSGRGGDGGSGLGAAIYNFGGQLIVTNTTFSGNTAVSGAGGPGGAGQSGGNGAQGGRGGDGGTAAGAAIYNSGNGFVSVTDSLFSSNNVAASAAGPGGPGGGTLGFPGRPGDPGMAAGAAVFNESGSVTLVNSTFSGNTGAGATGTAGTPGAGTMRAEDGKTGGPALGGAVLNLGSLSLTNCTFVQNFVLGGPGGAGGAGNPIGFGEDGGDGGNGGAALGGGLYTDGQSATWIVNCTFSDNTVQGGNGAIGGPGAGVGKKGRQGSLGRESGAALYSAQGATRLRNSILAHSAFAGNAGGAIADEGFNLSSDSTPLLSAQGSRNQLDALLGSLIAAGGLGSVLTLSSNSPAIDAIVAGGNGSPLFDQRNALRTEPFDIGAYESNGNFPAPSLQVQMQTNQVILSWPISQSFVLQRSTALSRTNPWTPVTDLPRTAGGSNSLTVTSGDQSAFFRLSR